MIDVLVTWPRWCDYPPFRRLMVRTRSHYRRLIVSFTGLEPDREMEGYIQSELPHALFVPASGDPCGDWRHDAVSAGLAISDAECVLFLEQDFLVRDPDDFFGALAGAARMDRPFVGFRENGRIHPACLLVKRETLEHTTLDFSAGAQGQDHFWFVTTELSHLAEFTDLESLGMERGRDWQHMAGLTHNYDLTRRGEPVTYRPGEFARYNLACLEIGSHPKFEALMVKCLKLVPVEELLFGGILT